MPSFIDYEKQITHAHVALWERERFNVRLSTNELIVSAKLHFASALPTQHDEVNVYVSQRWNSWGQVCVDDIMMEGGERGEGNRRTGGGSHLQTTKRQEHNKDIRMSTQNICVLNRCSAVAKVFHFSSWGFTEGWPASRVRLTDVYLCWHMMERVFTLCEKHNTKC